MTAAPHSPLVEKRCSKCGETKSLSDFHVNRKARSGRASWCKKCILHYKSTAWINRLRASGIIGDSVQNESDSNVVKHPLRTESHRRPPLAADEKDLIATMREGGCSYARIAMKLGRPTNTISWYCMMEGIESPKSKAKSWNAIKGPVVMKRGDSIVRRFTPEEDADLLRMEAAGHTIPNIARALCRRDHSVRYRLIVLARRDERALLAKLPA